MYLELCSSSFPSSSGNRIYFYSERNLIFLMELLEFRDGYFTCVNTGSGHCSWLLEYEFAADLN